MNLVLEIGAVIIAALVITGLLGRSRPTRRPNAGTEWRPK